VRRTGEPEQDRQRRAVAVAHCGLVTRPGSTPTRSTVPRRTAVTTAGTSSGPTDSTTATVEPDVPSRAASRSTEATGASARTRTAFPWAPGGDVESPGTTQ